MLIIYANNGAKIVNLPPAVVDMFFEIFNFDFPLTGSEGQIGVTFLQIFFDN